MVPEVARWKDVSSASHVGLESYFETKPINQFPSKLHVDTCLHASIVLSHKCAFSQQFFLLFQ